MGFVKDFKDFAVKGNVIDLAVGVVIGAAFGKIVTALVADVIMPLVSIITGGIKFTDKMFILSPGADGNSSFATLAAAREAGAVVLAYGDLIQSIVDFIIVSLCIFIVVRGVVKLQKKKAVEEAAEPTVSSTDILLTEIREELRKRPL